MVKASRSLLAAALISLGTNACGATGIAKEHASLAPAHAVPGAGSEATVQAQINDGSSRGYLGDRDGYIGGIEKNRGYHDSDDNPLSFSGHARVAGAAEARTITALVNRYYSFAASENGSRACSMLVPSLVVAMPLDYGKYGPSYLHGERTCPAIMVGIFKHSRDEMLGAVITGVVLIDEDHAAVMLGSAKMPASYMVLQREHGTWRIGSLLARDME